MDGVAKATVIDASWVWWTSMDFDVYSIFADSKFVDPVHGKFDMKPDSPVLKLGFQPMEADE
jgi:hypothetical protein